MAGYLHWLLLLGQREGREARREEGERCAVNHTPEWDPGSLRQLSSALLHRQDVSLDGC